MTSPPAIIGGGAYRCATNGGGRPGPGHTGSDGGSSSASGSVASSCSINTDGAATSPSRQTFEECAYRCGHVGKLHTRRVKDGVDAPTFLSDVGEEFQPKFNAEHDNFLWLDPQEALTLGGIDD
jgi:hypothetical protein